MTQVQTSPVSGLKSREPAVWREPRSGQGQEEMGTQLPEWDMAWPGGQVQPSTHLLEQLLPEEREEMEAQE